MWKNPFRIPEQRIRTNPFGYAQPSMKNGLIMPKPILVGSGGMQGGGMIVDRHKTGKTDDMIRARGLKPKKAYKKSR